MLYNCWLLFALFLICMIRMQECKKHNDSHLSKDKGKTVNTESIVYTVLKVADGDTITVSNDANGEHIRIRFLCIDAPEKSQPKWGEITQKKLAEMLPLNTKVKLAGHKIDVYGRLVAEIIDTKGINVNKKLVEIGLVVVYPFEKTCPQEYKDIEKKAKNLKLGVWSDPNFMMPWDYRKKECIGLRCQNDDKKVSTTKHQRDLQSPSTKHHHTHSKVESTGSTNKHHHTHSKVESTGSTNKHHYDLRSSSTRHESKTSSNLSTKAHKSTSKTTKHKSTTTTTTTLKTHKNHQHSSSKHSSTTTTKK